MTLKFVPCSFFLSAQRMTRVKKEEMTPIRKSTRLLNRCSPPSPVPKKINSNGTNKSQERVFSLKKFKIEEPFIYTNVIDRARDVKKYVGAHVSAAGGTQNAISNSMHIRYVYCLYFLKRIL